MPTVADVLKRIEKIKKDLEYVKSFEEKWRDQRERFPKIYQGILDQERAFRQKIDELRNLGVNAGNVLDSPHEAVSDTDLPKPVLTPAIESSLGNGRSKRREGSGDKRAAAESIGEKLRTRKTASGVAEARQ